MNSQTIFPLSVKQSYSPNDVVDFLISYEDKEIVQNSIRITGKVRVAADLTAAARITVTDDVKIDGTIGIHGAFQSITSSCDNVGILENQNEYPRYVKAKSAASTTAQMLFTDCQNTTELKAGVDDHTKYILIGNSTTSQDDAKIPFSFKPDIALNKTSENIAFNKCGGVKLSLRLATTSQFLYGTAASNYNYALYDLRLEYIAAPMKTTGPLTLETIHMIKTTAESNNTSISTRVPAIVQSVSMVFHVEDQLNTAAYNHVALEVPPAISRCEFSFNDSTTQYYNFALESEEELLYNYQQSWGNPGGSKSNITLSRLNANESYGIGMPFGSYIDMTKGSKFGVNILSNIQSTLKYGVFLYFRGVIKI
jgi:hypothetical protein